MPKLSPAAQAAVSAIREASYDWPNMDQAHPNVIAAAVLRPKPPTLDELALQFLGFDCQM